MVNNNIFLAQPFHGAARAEEDTRTRTLAIKYLQSQGEPDSTNYMSGYLVPEDQRDNPIQGMAYSFEIMSRCNIFVFLPGWENARGCKIEHDMLKAYGYPVEYITSEELADFEDSLIAVPGKHRREDDDE